jgi:hypothetical protein
VLCLTELCSLITFKMYRKVVRTIQRAPARPSLGSTMGSTMVSVRLHFFFLSLLHIVTITILLNYLRCHHGSPKVKGILPATTFKYQTQGI